MGNPPAVRAQIQPMTPRVRRLRDNLIDLAVELQAQGNRMHNAGGVCMEQADNIKRAAWAAARSAWHIGGNEQSLSMFFPGCGSGKRDSDAPAHGDELELED